MKSEMAIDEARELVANRLLWPRVRDFLWDFAPSIHGSWMEELKVVKLKVESSEDVAATNLQPSNLQPSTMSSPRVKRFILDSLGVEPFFHAFPKEDGSRIALLDGDTLLEVAKWLGALALADNLRRVTDGATVRALKSALPGVYPEVFGYTEYFRTLKVEGLKVESSLPDLVVSLGCAMVHSFVATLPDPLRHRLALKLPRNLQPSNLQPSTCNLQLLLKLLKLRFPEAHSLCCS